VNHPTAYGRRVAWIVAWVAITLFVPTSSRAAAKIQHLISPGGIEAWFVQDTTVPLIAMEAQPRTRRTSPG
jgi:zinc protease